MAAAALLSVLLPLISCTPVIAAAYLWFAVDLGPRLMRDRQPLRVKPLIALYNALQMALNAILLWRTVPILMDRRYDLACPRPISALHDSEDGEVSDGTFTQEIMHVTRYQAALRLLDLSDTVFIILLKKNNQLTFLHLYHHTSMILIPWLILQLDAGAATGLVAVAINNVIHFIMYTYYLLTLFHFPSARLYKRYITQLQILQFALVELYMLQAFLRSHCDTSLPIVTMNILQSIVFLALFINYYLTTYKRKKIV